MYVSWMSFTFCNINDIAGCASQVHKGHSLHSVYCWHACTLVSCVTYQSTLKWAHYTTICWLVHWHWLLHLVQRGGDWVGPQPTHAPPRSTKCNSLPISG